MNRDPDTSLADQYQSIRDTTVQLCATLAPEDTVVQSMPDVSPAKWHLAHITWFFERFVLEEFVSGYRRFDDGFDFLFNSYYYSVGQMHARPRRGLVSRPTYIEILSYRTHVDAAIRQLLEQRDDRAIVERIVLGLNHEQQHQELLLTDIKHVFSCNPLSPAVNPELKLPGSASADEYSYSNGSSGIRAIGASCSTLIITRSGRCMLGHVVDWCRDRPISKSFATGHTSMLQ